MEGVNGAGYSGMMVGLNQIQGVGAKIQRAFAPSTEMHVVGDFGRLQSGSPSGNGNPSFGTMNYSVKGLMINIFA
jgi:hypothetical protein